MILAIDIGNTTVAAYLVDATEGIKDIKVLSEGKIPSDADYTLEEYRRQLKRLLDTFEIPIEQITDCAMSSVVPRVTKLVCQALAELLQLQPKVLTRTDNTLLSLQVREPDKVGLDRIMDAVGAASIYPLPIITVDMGTATTFNVIDDNYTFLGGAISAGIRTGLKALSNNAALLPEISLHKPDYVIGKHTIACMESGAVYGTAALVDGMILRLEKELGKKATIVMTGGGAKYVHELCMHEHVYEPYLLVKGMIYLSQRLVSD